MLPSRRRQRGPSGPRRPRRGPGAAERSRSDRPAPLRALVLVPMVVAVGVGVSVRPTSGAAGPVRANADRARTTFLADCATCHGPQGTGTTRGPTLKGVGAASVDYMMRSGRMPLEDETDEMERREPKYSAQLLDDLIAYSTDLTGGGPAIPEVDPEAGDLSSGAELYRLQCAACHSWGGTGGALEGRQAPSVIPADPTGIAEAVRIGPGKMPEFGEAAFDQQQLDDITAYVQSLDHPEDRGGADLGYYGPVAEGAVAIVIGLGGMVLVLRWLGEHR